MAHREYSDEIKAQVMASLLAGQSIGAVASEYKVPTGTVKSWKRQGKQFRPVDPQKKDEIGDLLLAYLRTMLRTLTIQAEHFGDKTWLNRQDASQLAVLHGVSTDKVIRLLEALEGDRNDASGT